MAGALTDVVSLCGKGCGSQVFCAGHGCTHRASRFKGSCRVAREHVKKIKELSGRVVDIGVAVCDEYYHKVLML